MKSNSVMTRTIVGTVISWLFKSGKTESIDVATLTPELKELGLIHGISQKVGDAAAMSVVDGKPATEDQKREAMRKVIDALNLGQWSGPRESNDGVLLQALQVVYPKKSADKLREYLKPLSATQKLALSDQPKIKRAIGDIQAARIKASGVVLADLVAELEAIGDAATDGLPRHEVAKA